MSVYLVAGGAGFIGTNFVSYLRSRHPGDKVVVVDYLGFASNLDNLAQFGERTVEFRAADVSDPVAMTAVYEEFHPDFVVNFAAESHNDRAIIDPSLFMRSNALGAQVLLECSRRRPVSAHLHVSTIEVYGSSRPTARTSLRAARSTPRRRTVRRRRLGTRSSGRICRRTRR